MPTFKQKRDQNHYYEGLMQGYPNKKWYIREDKDTPYNLKWDCIALNACADDEFSYEQARDFLETHSDEIAAAYYKELERRLNVFKAAQAHNHATFLLNEIVKIDESIARDFSVFESDEWPDLSIKVDGKAAVIVEWDKENVVLRIDLRNVQRHSVNESGDADDPLLIKSIEDISDVYSIDLESIDRALRRFGEFFSNGLADIE